MKPFRATYTPQYGDERKNKPQTVLVIKVGVDEEGGWAIFIDEDNSLKLGSFRYFTNCQSSEWRE